MKFHPELEPDVTDHSYVDVAGHAHSGRVLLEQPVGMQLVIGTGPSPTVDWRPEDLAQRSTAWRSPSRYLNGTRLGPGQPLDLEYPSTVDHAHNAPQLMPSSGA
jgi:hypothetical protein